MNGSSFSLSFCFGADKGTFVDLGAFLLVWFVGRVVLFEDDWVGLVLKGGSVCGMYGYCQIF